MPSKRIAGSLQLLAIVIVFSCGGERPARAQDGYVFSTVAGKPGESGASDGAGTLARFKHPVGVAVDPNGDVLITDEGNATIRKLTRTGVVSTVAGKAGFTGATDGTAANARFGKSTTFNFSDGTSVTNTVGPTGVCVGPDNTVYVADTGNLSIRMISAGTVTSRYVAIQSTPAPGQPPPPPKSAFLAPYGVALERDGNLLVSDPNSYTVFRLELKPVGLPHPLGGVKIMQPGHGFPSGLALSPRGTLYVAFSGTFTLHELDLNLALTTIAGSSNQPGIADGVGADARFGGDLELAAYLVNARQGWQSGAMIGAGPAGLACDASDTVFVADQISHTIRKVSSNRAVSTIGGTPNRAHSADGAGTTAGFSRPTGVALDQWGNLYVADSGNHTIRKGTPAYRPRIETQPGDISATVGSPVTLAVAATGTQPLTYQWRKNGVILSGASDSQLGLASLTPADGGEYSVTITNVLGSITSRSAIVSVGSAPAIQQQPAALAVVAGQPAQLSIAISSPDSVSYQWRRDGVEIQGATAARLEFSSVRFEDEADYSVVVNTRSGSVTSAVARLTVQPFTAGHLVNLSIRTNSGTGDDTLIVGATFGGGGTSGTKAVLLRAVGPTLGAFGVTGALADPVMTLFQGTAEFAQNDDWAGGFDFSAVGAFAFTGANPRDAAIYDARAPTGSYSIQIAGKNNTTGTALAEIYDATPPARFTATTPRLINLSARTPVGTGDDILIAGFVVGGVTPVRVLIRAVGPTLTGFGVSGALADPRLEIYTGTNRTAENDNWDSAIAPTFARVGAFNFSVGSKDAALVAILSPGSYTAQVSGVGGSTGITLVEVYELP